MKWFVPIRWEVEGAMIVTANTKAEALAQVLNQPRTIEKNYVSPVTVDLKKVRRVR